MTTIRVYGYFWKQWFFLWTITISITEFMEFPLWLQAKYKQTETVMILSPFCMLELVLAEFLCTWNLNKFYFSIVVFLFFAIIQSTNPSLLSFVYYFHSFVTNHPLSLRPPTPFIRYMHKCPNLIIIRYSLGFRFAVVSVRGVHSVSITSQWLICHRPEAVWRSVN